MEFITPWVWSPEDIVSGFLSATVVYGAIWALFHWK